MVKYQKVSFNCDIEILKGIRKYVNLTPGMNQSTAINLHLMDAIKLKKEVERYKNLYELAALKTLFILREIAGTRPDDFIESVDEKFSDSLRDMKEMIEQGIDYVGN